MSLGFRFRLGPLVAYIPLTGRRKNRRRKPQGNGGGEAFAALARGVVVVVGFVLLWPYLVARHVGAQLRWPAGQSIAVGVAGVALWWLAGMVFSAVTGQA